MKNIVEKKSFLLCNFFRRIYLQKWENKLPCRLISVWNSKSSFDKHWDELFVFVDSLLELLASSELLRLKLSPLFLWIGLLWASCNFGYFRFKNRDEFTKFGTQFVVLIILGYWLSFVINSFLLIVSVSI